MEPFPEVRVDVVGLDPLIAHRKIMDNARVMFLPPAPGHRLPSDVVEQVGAVGEGIIAILERHAPGPHGLCASEDSVGERWPCDDYRDAARGLARGLPADA